jgi:hypothetical protein
MAATTAVRADDSDLASVVPASLPADLEAQRIGLRPSFSQPHLTNDLLAAYVRDAPATLPGTTMPAMPLTASEARDIAAYLYAATGQRR